MKIGLIPIIRARPIGLARGAGDIDPTPSIADDTCERRKPYRTGDRKLRTRLVRAGSNLLIIAQRSRPSHNPLQTALSRLRGLCGL
jgi:hypothetical protein